MDELATNPVDASVDIAAATAAATNTALKREGSISAAIVGIAISREPINSLPYMARAIKPFK